MVLKSMKKTRSDLDLPNNTTTPPVPERSNPLVWSRSASTALPYYNTSLLSVFNAILQCSCLTKKMFLRSYKAFPSLPTTQSLILYPLPNAPSTANKKNISWYQWLQALSSQWSTIRHGFSWTAADIVVYVCEELVCGPEKAEGEWMV